MPSCTQSPFFWGYSRSRLYWKWKENYVSLRRLQRNMQAALTRLSGSREQSQRPQLYRSLWMLQSRMHLNTRIPLLKFISSLLLLLYIYGILQKVCICLYSYVNQLLFTTKNNIFLLFSHISTHVLNWTMKCGVYVARKILLNSNISFIISLH